MPVSVDSLVVGQKYARSYLAKLWGYKDENYLTHRIFIPGGNEVIVLFLSDSTSLGEEGLWLDIVGDREEHSFKKAKANGIKVYAFARPGSFGAFEYLGEVVFTGIAEMSGMQKLRFVFNYNILDSKSLRECDTCLEAMLPASGLLGDIELSNDEYEHLKNHIKAGLTNTGEIISSHLTVAVFLVWNGIRNYSDGAYWGSVYRDLSLPNSQLKWQGYLGDIFLSLLEKYNLPRFVMGHRYITPILAHGRVPDSFVNTFLEGVIYPLCRDRAGERIVRLDIIHLVSLWRLEAEELRLLGSELDELRGMESNLQLSLDVHNNKETLVALRRLDREIADVKKQVPHIMDIFEVPEEDFRSIIKELDEVSSRIASLETEKELAIQPFQSSTAASEVLRKKLFSELFNTPWDDSFKGPIQQLNIPILRAKISEYIRLSEVFHRVPTFSSLLRLLLPSRWRRTKTLLVEILEHLNELPDCEAISLTICDGLYEIQQLCYRIEESNVAQKEISVTLETDSLAELRANRAMLKQRQDRYSKVLSKLGQGSMAANLVALNDFKKKVYSVQVLSQKIKSEFPLNKLLSLEGTQSLSKEDVIVELRKIRVRKNEVERQLKIYRHPINSLNEAARTFILEGDAVATDFVYGCLLKMSFLAGNVQEDTCQIPRRFEEVITDWWQKIGKTAYTSTHQSPTIGRTGVTSLTHKRPSILFSVKTASIMVEVPEYRFDSIAEHCKLVINGDQGNELEMVEIRVFRDGDGYKTESVSCTLPGPSATYRLILEYGDEKISWTVDGIQSESPFLLFSSRGDLLEKHDLVKDEVYVVASNKVIIEPRSAEEAREEMHSGWAGHSYHRLNISDLNAAIISVEANVAVLRKTASLKPQFIGGSILEGVSSGEKIVYSVKAPAIILSAKDEVAVKLLRVGISENSGSDLSIKAMEIEGTSFKGGILYIPLSGLLSGKFGEFRVKLSGRSETLLADSIIVVPSMEYKFDSRIYPPGTSKKAILTVTGDLEKCRPALPAQLMSKVQTCFKIYFAPGNDVVSCSLGIGRQDDNSINVPVDIKIPKILWRMGADWKFRTEEIWHQEIGEVEVTVPIGFTGKAFLVLNKDEQRLSRDIKGTFLTYEPERFVDTIRQSSESTHDVFLQLPGCKKVLLFTVRSKWQPDSLTVNQKLADGNRYLNFVWKDYGKAVNRALRLWNLKPSGDSPRYHEWEIPDGKSELNVTTIALQMPRGTYQAHMFVKDPWGDEQIRKPGSGDYYKNVEIGSSSEEARVGAVAPYVRTRKNIISPMVSLYEKKCIACNEYYQGQKLLVLSYICPKCLILHADRILDCARCHNRFYRSEPRDFYASWEYCIPCGENNNKKKT